MRSGPTDNVALHGFRRGLRELGYLEGRDVVLEIRYAGAGTKTLSDLAAELAGSRATSSAPRAGSRRGAPRNRHGRAPPWSRGAAAPGERSRARAPPRPPGRSAAGP